MTPSVDARFLGFLRRRSLLLAGVLLLAAAGTAVWFAHRSSAPPTPPPVPPDPAEPNAAAFIEKSRERVLKEPRSAQAWGALGQVFLANEIEEESRVCFTEAERLDPSDPRWPYDHAQSLLHSGKPEAALSCLRRAAARCAGAGPEYQVPRLLLAEILLTVGRVDEAEDHLRPMLAEQPDDPRTHYDLALVASARQDWTTSKSHLLHCLSSPLVRRKASAQLAAVCQRLGEQVEAEKYHERAKHLPADSGWHDPFEAEYLRWAVKKNSRYRLIDSLKASGQMREAMAELQPLLEQYPNDYFPHLIAGKLFGGMGNYPGAVAILRQAVRLAPDKAEPHYYLSLALFEEAEELTRKGGGRDAAGELFREAVASSRQTLAIDPEYDFAYMPLGRSLKRLGRQAEALAALRGWSAAIPNSRSRIFILATYLSRKGS